MDSKVQAVIDEAKDFNWKERSLQADNITSEEYDNLFNFWGEREADWRIAKSSDGFYEVYKLDEERCEAPGADLEGIKSIHFNTLLEVEEFILDKGYAHYQHRLKGKWEFVNMEHRRTPEQEKRRWMKTD